MPNYVVVYLRLEDRAVGAESKAEEYRWEQCRLAAEAVTDGGLTMTAFAKAVGKSTQTISYQCAIWQRFHARGNRPTYADAYAQIRGLPQGPERTRDMNIQGARQALKDPALVEQLLGDREVRASVAKAQARVYEKAEERQRERTPEAVESREESAAVIAGLRAVRALRDCVRGLQGVRPNKRLRDDLAYIAEQTRLYLDFIESASEATQTLSDEVEDFLATVGEDR